MGQGSNKMTASTTPTVSEQRLKSRRRVQTYGRVCFFNGTQFFDCTIYDLTGSGARIRLSNIQPMPSCVYLINIGDGMAYEAYLVRRDDQEAGLMFVNTLSLAELTSPELDYLIKLWHDHPNR